MGHFDRGDRPLGRRFSCVSGTGAGKTGRATARSESAAARRAGHEDAVVETLPTGENRLRHDGDSQQDESKTCNAHLFSFVRLSGTIALQFS
jgi:hypothetical protein